MEKNKMQRGDFVKAAIPGAAAFVTSIPGMALSAEYWIIAKPVCLWFCLSTWWFQRDTGTNISFAIERTGNGKILIFKCEKIIESGIMKAYRLFE